jgi:hypothetical protein
MGKLTQAADALEMKLSAGIAPKNAHEKLIKPADEGVELVANLCTGYRRDRDCREAVRL